MQVRNMQTKGDIVCVFYDKQQNYPNNYFVTQYVKINRLEDIAPIMETVNIKYKLSLIYFSVGRVINFELTNSK